MAEIIEFNLDNAEAIEQTTDLYTGRVAATKAMKKISKIDSEVTIIVMAYNRLEKTKRCVESVLKYTTDVDYDLILIDNGSSDGTFEYFKSIEFEKVRIVRVTKNISAGMPYCLMDLNWFSDYVVGIANDIVVTENWLSNLLKVAKSDPKIGMVNPVCSNTSNLQCVNFEFSDYDDMQEKARIMNVSDPKKWEERLRLITLGTLYAKPCLFALGWPNFDVGFFHDFVDDDITFRVRRAGYKAVLARDTWIHHDHNIRAGEDKDPVEFRNSILCGKQNFRDKYFGVDAWDDVNNYISPYLKGKLLPPADPENVKVLGIDVKSGTPILDIKNMIREFSAFEPETHAFFKDSKYDIDLRTICNGSVVCDRIDYLYNSFATDYFDYIVLGDNINEYPEPGKVVQDAFALLKKGGQLYFTYKNTFDIYTLLKCVGHDIGASSMAVHCKAEDFCEIIGSGVGADVELVSAQFHETDDSVKQFLNSVLDVSMPQNANRNLIINNLNIDKYWLRVIK